MIVAFGRSVFAALVAGSFVSLVALVPTRAAAQDLCRVTCMPGETRDAAGCCVAEGATEGSASPDLTVGCPAGHVRPQLDGPCCFPNQVVHEGACRGIPSACPAGFAVDAPNETCALLACEPGKERADDGVTCCFAGQVSVDGACRGVPTSCPPDHDRDGETCRPRPTRLRVSVDATAERASEAEGAAAQFRFRGVEDAQERFACEARPDAECAAEFEPPRAPLRVEVQRWNGSDWAPLAIAGDEAARQLRSGPETLTLFAEQRMTEPRRRRLWAGLAIGGVAAVVAPPLIVRSREHRYKDQAGVYHRNGTGRAMIFSGIAVAAVGTVALSWGPVSGRSHREPPAWHLRWGLDDGPTRPNP